MQILAIDPNTKTGLAEGEPGDRPHLETQNFRRDDTDEPEDILERATFYFADRFRQRSPGAIFIEAPVPPSQLTGATTFNTTLVTIGIYAIVVGIARCKSIPIEKAHISSWRKYALGSGRLKGADAKRLAVRLCGQLGWSAPDHNAAEAGCIWLYGCAQLSPATTIRHEPLFVRGAA